MGAEVTGCLADLVAFSLLWVLFSACWLWEAERDVRRAQGGRSKCGAAVRGRRDGNR